MVGREPLGLQAPGGGHRNRDSPQTSVLSGESEQRLPGQLGLPAFWQQVLEQNRTQKADRGRLSSVAGGRTF